MLIEPQFGDYSGDDFSEGLARVKIKGKWGFIDKTGCLAIEPRFRFANFFREGLAPVMMHV